MNRRQGFTIVELLVAMALIIFIMSILSEAFVTATTTFRTLKAMGDMAERMRSAANLIRLDLMADHFEGKKRLSQPDFWLTGPPDEGFFRIYNGSLPSTTNPPNTQAPCFKEGNDLDLLDSFVSRDHMLHFSIKLRGNQRGDFLSASVPGGSPLISIGDPFRRYQDTPNTYTSQWAEVAYFLQQVSTLDATTGTPSMPLFSLYRRVRLAVMDTGTKVSVPAPTNPPITDYPGVSNANGTFNSPADLTVPSRRFGMISSSGLTDKSSALAGVFANSAAPTFSGYPPLGSIANEDPNLFGSDVLLTDVISFDVRGLFAFWPQTSVPSVPTPIGTDFVNLYDANITPYINGNPAFPGGNTGAAVFDTWTKIQDDHDDYITNPNNANTQIAAWNPPSSGNPATYKTIPMFQNTSTGNRIQLLAIQIIIRVWDSKTMQSRQMSIVQDL